MGAATPLAPLAGGYPVRPSPGRDHRVRLRFDPGLLIPVAALTTVGLLVTYTASYTVGYSFHEDGTFFLKRQLIWLALAGAAGAIGVALDYRSWRRYCAPAMGLTVAMLTALVLFGGERFGSARWVTAGGSIQPSELAKLTTVLFVADWLAAKRDHVKDFSLGLVPFAVITGVVCGLILLQPDFSTAVLLGAVAGTMFFLAGADLKHLLKAGAAAGAALAVVMVQAPYRLARWETFLDPEGDPSGAGFQILQSLEAITRGGIFGVGLGNGQNKHLLPAPHTDGVFAVLGEELGLVGGLAVLGLFVLIAWRGFRVAAAAPDAFGSLLAVGITSWIVLQALVNMAVATAVMPFTGIPLPWVSFGGSNLVACSAAMGILLNISGHLDQNRAKLYAGVGLRWRNRRSRLSRADRARRLAGGEF
jgi:cell division protein FtsW